MSILSGIINSISRTLGVLIEQLDEGSSILLEQLGLLAQPQPVPARIDATDEGSRQEPAD